MSSNKLIEQILDENLVGAQETLNDLLYSRAAEGLRDMAEMSALRSFSPRNACPDEVILGEAKNVDTDHSGFHKMMRTEADLSPEQEAFRKLFKKILKKHGVKSPNELDDQKKREFYSEVGAEWAKDPANTPEKNESVNEQDNPRYVTTPMRMPERRPAANPLFPPGSVDTPFKIPMRPDFLPRPEVGEPGGPAGPPQPKPYMPGGPRPTRPAYSEPGPDSRRMPRQMPSMEDIMKMISQYYA